MIQLPQGVVKIAEYQQLLSSLFFKEIEKFSSDFIINNKPVLLPYYKKWVMDPLHQWSRQWEYPFVYSHIQEHIKSYGITSPKILDAGSGITFFPHFLKTVIPQAEITCCDTDTTLESIFTSINSDKETGVKFLCKDIRKIGLEDNSFDIIYCVSVLEHTKNYGEIVKEFHRLLKNNGILIVTFDISLDGQGDIPACELKNLIVAINTFLTTTEQSSINELLDEKMLLNKDIVTTQFISELDKSLLPWKYPVLSAIKSSLKQKKIPLFNMKNLAVSCNTFSKKDSR